MEQFLQANDSCRLMVHNLSSYVKNEFTDKAEFDFDLFYKNAYEGLRLGDDLIDLEYEYIQRIIDKIKSDPEPDNIKRQELELWEKSQQIAIQGRRIGMGITALGDTLAMLGLKYDSDEGLDMVDKIMSTKMEAELDCTIDLGILRGTFKGWDIRKEYFRSNPDMSGQLHKFYIGKNSFYEFLAKEFPVQASRMIEYGRRNVSFSTISPTGSVSLLANNCTSGCEPLFLPYYFRKKKAIKGENPTSYGEDGQGYVEFPVLHPKFVEWYIKEANSEHVPHIAIQALQRGSKEDLQKVFEQSPWFGSTANDINWIRRIEMQSILQKYTTNAISSTINLPRDITEEEVSNIYLEAWKKGLKGITIFRDGSRDGILSSETKKYNSFKDEDAIKRPRELKAETYYSTTKGINYHVIIGLLDDRPYEVFIDDSENKYSEKGLLIKQGKGKYLFVGDDEEIVIRDFMNPEQQAITRLTSGWLRQKGHVKYIVEQLNKIDGDMFSFAKSLARVLKKYIPDGEKSTLTCNECGSKEVIFEEGCSKCLSCGSSKCG